MGRGFRAYQFWVAGLMDAEGFSNVYLSIEMGRELRLNVRQSGLGCE